MKGQHDWGVIEQIKHHEGVTVLGVKGSHDGYSVVTSSGQVVFVLVDDGSTCCESWGAISSFEEPKEFMGAKLLKVEKVDIGLSKKMIDAAEWVDQGDIMFVNFETDRGLFQLAVYNAHNGYYGHVATLCVSRVKTIHQVCL